VPPAPPDPLKRRDFLIGLGIGAVPLVLALLAIGFLASAAYSNSNYANLSVAGTLGLIAGAVYLIALVVMLILAIIPRTRMIGLGMLTALAADLVIVFVGCLVALNIASRAAPSPGVPPPGATP
jgi:hypothetical protein